MSQRHHIAGHHVNHALLIAVLYGVLQLHYQSTSCDQSRMTTVHVGHFVPKAVYRAVY